jgi:hypothetical protein
LVGKPTARRSEIENPDLPNQPRSSLDSGARDSTEAPACRETRSDVRPRKQTLPVHWAAIYTLGAVDVAKYRSTRGFGRTLLPFVTFVTGLLFIGAGLATFRTLWRRRALASRPIEFLIPGDAAQRSTKTKLLAELHAQMSNSHLLIAHKSSLVCARNKVARELLDRLKEDFTRLGILTEASIAVVDRHQRQRTLAGLLAGFQFATWRAVANLALLTDAQSVWGVQNLQTLVRSRERDLASLLKDLDRDVYSQQRSLNRSTTAAGKRIV